MRAPTAWLVAANVVNGPKGNSRLSFGLLDQLKAGENGPS
jgi:hypothetical protein